MKVVIFLSNPVRAFAPEPEQLETLSARLPGHEVVAVHTDAELLRQLPLADAAVVWSFQQGWYASAARLAHLFTPAAGREQLAPDPSGRVQQHFGRFHGAIMAESLLGMILFMNRKLGAALDAQARHRWDRAPYSLCRRLYGQVVLIIGYGAIGQRCARLLAGLGMVVHGLRRQASEPDGVAARLFTPERRFEALALADHVVCVLPGGTATDHVLDAEALAHIKPSGVVYNIGRGNAIDPEALRRALEEGRIAGAFLDVQHEEPLPASSASWATPNLFLTPHASAISREYLDLYFEELAEQLLGLA